MRFFEGGGGWVQPFGSADGLASGVFQVKGELGSTTYLPFDYEYENSPYDNALYIYEIVDAQGGLETLDGQRIYAPSEKEWAENPTQARAKAFAYQEVAKLQSFRLFGPKERPQDTSDVMLPAGAYYGFYMVQDDNPEANHWFSVSEANADKAFPHFVKATAADPGFSGLPMYKFEEFTTSYTGIANPDGLISGSFDYSAMSVSDCNRDDTPPSKNADNEKGSVCDCPEEKLAIPNGRARVETNQGSVTQPANSQCETCGSEETNLPQHQSQPNPHPIIEVHWRIPTGQAVPSRLEVSLDFGGLTGSTVYYDTTGLSAGQTVRIVMQADATSLASGRHAYTMTIGAVRSGGTTNHLISGYHEIFNRIDSEYGNRMWIESLDRLVIGTTGVSLIRGDETACWFQKVGSNYITRDGSFTTLVKNNDDTYTLTHKDGRKDEFGTTGLLTARKAANGETTTYTYTDADSDTVADELASITDPFGRTTTYTFSSGKLASVTDHAGRTTSYSYTSGRLTTLTEPDPDGAGPGAAPVTTYAYYANGLLETLTEPGGHVTEYEYDFAGRVSRVTADGNDWTLSAAEVAGLVDLNSTGYDASNLASSSHLTAVVEAVYTDELGNVTRYEHDGHGYVTKMTDDLGTVWHYERNSDGMLTKLIEPDPDGAGPLTATETRYQYDAYGNRIKTIYADNSNETWIYDTTFGRPTSYIDRARRQTLWTLDPTTGDVLSMTQVVRQVDSVGNGQTDDVTWHYSYTDGTGDLPQGLLTEVEDPQGRVTTYVYFDDDTDDEFGWVKYIIYADGTADEAQVEFEYDLAGNVTAFIDELGRRTEYGYNDLDQLVHLTLPDPDGAGPLASPEYFYTYCTCGEMTSMEDALGNITEYEYGDSKRLTKIIQPDPDGTAPFDNLETVYAYDDHGNLTSVTDPLGRVTSYEYDELNRVKKMVLPDPDGVGGASSPDIDYTYDLAGNLQTVTDPLGNVTTYRYNRFHWLVEVKQPDPDGTTPFVNPTTSYAYDKSGLLTSVTDPLGRVTSYEYDALGRTTKVTMPDPDGGGAGLAPWVVFAYDKASNLTSVTDRLNHATTYGYDNRNRRTSETNAEGDSTTFGYDDAGNLTSLTDPESNTTSWVYDALNRVVEEENELADSRFFEYDAMSNLVEKTDRNGRVNEYEYDALLRLVEERWKSGGSTMHTINWTYDDANQLTEAADSFAEYDYTYDNLGRATSIVADLAGLSSAVTLAQGFDANSRRTQLSATIGSTADFKNDYTFDTLNRLTQVTQQDVVGGNAVADKRVDIGYNAAGQFTSINRYANLAGTALVATSAYSYDNTGRLTGLSHTKGGTTFAGYGWAYDAANRITSFTNSQHATENATYTYDNTDQLTGADRTGSGNDESYAYDDNGNRLNAGYVTGANNRMESDGTYNYTYDAEGNTLTRTRISNDPADDYLTEYTWDHRNRLTKVTFKDNSNDVTKAVEQGYDAFNRWISRTVDPDGDLGSAAIEETYFVYDGTQIALQFDGNSAGDLSHRYLWGPAVDQLFADEDATGDVLWALTDHQGTVRDVAEYDANLDETIVVNHNTYNGFGVKTDQTDAARDLLFGYTGRAFDKETGLQNNWYRWYNADAGRWLSEDPIGFAGSDANLSRYVTNDSVNWVDSTGTRKKKGGQSGQNITDIAPKLGSGYWLVVCVNTGGDFAGGAGHSWIGIVDTTGKDPAINGSGFYPCEAPNPTYKTVPGEIRDDSELSYEYCRAYPISKNQFNKLQEKLERKQRNPGNYQVRVKNCTTWAVDVLDDVYPMFECRKDQRGIGSDPTRPFDPFYSPSSLCKTLREDNTPGSQPFE